MMHHKSCIWVHKGFRVDYGFTLRLASSGESFANDRISTKAVPGVAGSGSGRVISVFKPSAQNSSVFISFIPR